VFCCPLLLFCVVLHYRVVLHYVLLLSFTQLQMYDNHCSTHASCYYSSCGTHQAFQACCATLGTCQHLSLPGQQFACLCADRCYQCRDWRYQFFGHPSLASNTSKHVMLELIGALINFVCVCCRNHAPVISC